MDAWSLMRGDTFIHFVCGSRWVNIRLGVLLLIPKSPQPSLKPVAISRQESSLPYYLSINSGVEEMDSCQSQDHSPVTRCLYLEYFQWWQERVQKKEKPYSKWGMGYRHRKWTWWHEFKSWMRLIAFSHSTNTFGKGMNPIILPPAMGK